MIFIIIIPHLYRRIFDQLTPCFIMSYKKPNLKTKYYHDFVSNIKDQSGKFFAITGTTTGTGYYAALAIGKKGGTVLLLNRESERS